MVAKSPHVGAQAFQVLRACLDAHDARLGVAVVPQLGEGPDVSADVHDHLVVGKLSEQIGPVAIVPVNVVDDDQVLLHVVVANPEIAEFDQSGAGRRRPGAQDFQGGGGQVPAVPPEAVAVVPIEIGPRPGVLHGRNGFVVVRDEVQEMGAQVHELEGVMFGPDAEGGRVGGPGAFLRSGVDAGVQAALGDERGDALGVAGAEAAPEVAGMNGGAKDALAVGQGLSRSQSRMTGTKPAARTASHRTAACSWERFFLWVLVLPW